ncbi:MAG: aspartate-semialdehyde dehydrogenase [Candidatus Melainabacteria bacterium GWF2_37_15]|nr:MAG: aspartate-semialdehyde dehydrogenase [Candidatus Melainabacteria bacterium GWF2_37_15]
MSNPNIAILGATGVVGQEILKILEERNFLFNNIKFLASARSAGKEIEFKGKKYTIEEATPKAFEGVDIVLASAGAATSKALVNDIVKAGAVLVDNSSAFRMEPDVPLVIAGVNDEDLKWHKGVVANPNCSTSQLMLPLKPLHEYGTIKRMIVTTYQSVSGAGKDAIDDLRDGTRKKFAKHPINFNLIPQIDVFLENGYTKEEMKVVNETRKILHLSDDVKISCTAVRVPVYISHSEVVNIEFERNITPEKAREILTSAYGVEVIDNPENSEYPTPIDAAGKDPVYVGRIRKGLALDNELVMWVVADNLRIGAALNTVRIAEKLVEMNLIKNVK